MPNVVFGRILRVPLIENAPHLMFDLHRVGILLDNVVLMKDVTEEVAVVELVNELRSDRVR